MNTLLFLFKKKNNADRGKKRGKGGGGGEGQGEKGALPYSPITFFKEKGGGKGVSASVGKGRNRKDNGENSSSPGNELLREGSFDFWSKEASECDE